MVSAIAAMSLCLVAAFAVPTVLASEPEPERFTVRVCVSEHICVTTCAMGDIGTNVVDKAINCAKGRLPFCGGDCPPFPFLP